MSASARSRSAPEATQIVNDAGFCVAHVELVEKDNEKATFLWITARKL